MNNLSLQQLGQGVGRFLLRFHFVLFVLIVVGSMAAIIWSIDRTLARAADTSSLSDAATQRTFDKTTIQRVDELRSTQDQTELVIPTDTRTNPFTE